MGAGAFRWYELLTTDLPAAQHFYGKVAGWGTQDASTPQFAYRVFSAGEMPVGGLMELPLQGRKLGAKPRWVGYIAVDDVDRMVARLKALGGSVYVPATNSNIGRIAVVADPQTATFALVNGFKYGGQAAAAPEHGHVSWHELVAADSKSAFVFYSTLFGWEQAEAAAASIDSYQSFAAGGRTLGGIFTKFETAPVPFWLYYFDVADLDVSVDRVRSEGGQVVRGPIELGRGIWIAHCIDPQGAMFALQGKRSESAGGRARRADAGSALGWSAAWGGISSSGRLVMPKPKAKDPKGKDPGSA